MAVAIVVLLVLELLGVRSLDFTKYSQRSMCNLRDRINNGCFVPVSGRSRAECAADCSTKPTCSQFLFSTQDNTCYIQSSCGFAPACSVFDPHLVFYTSEIDTVTTEEPAVTTSGPVVTTSGPVVTTSGPVVTTSGPVVTTSGPVVTTTEPAVTTSEPAVTTTEPVVMTSWNKVTTQEPNVETTQNPCQNGGVFSGGVCQCSQSRGFVGTYCERNPTSCLELQQYGYLDDVYSVILDILGDGSKLVSSYCSIKAGSVERDLIRSSGNFDTNYNFETYKNGFNLGPKDFFTGLEDMYSLLQNGAVVIATVHYNSSSFYGRAWFREVKKANKKSPLKYSLIRYDHISSESGTELYPASASTDGLVPDDEVLARIGAYFSTADNDQDNNFIDNCAQLVSRGWWYEATICDGLNPLGFNYEALPGPTTSKHFYIPGLDVEKIKSAFDYFSVSFVES